MDCSPFVQAVLESFHTVARPTARGASVPQDRRAALLHHAAMNLRWLAFLRGRP